MKIFQISQVVLQIICQSFFKFCITLQCHVRQLLCIFLSQELYILHKRNQSKCKLFRLSSARVKIQLILLIFETTNQFFFKFCITLQCHEHNSSVPFYLKFYILSTKGGSLSKYQFGESSSEQSKIWNFTLWWSPFIQMI